MHPHANQIQRLITNRRKMHTWNYFQVDLSYSVFTSPTVRISLRNEITIYCLRERNWIQMKRAAEEKCTSCSLSSGRVSRGGGIFKLGELALFMDHQSRWNFDKHAAFNPHPVAKSVWAGLLTCAYRGSMVLANKIKRVIRRDKIIHNLQTTTLELLQQP